MSGIEINRTDLGLRANITCPYCWADYSPEDVKWISESSELLGDPKLGEQFQRRFLPSQFNVAGNAVDANNHVCHKLACPNCHLSIPRSLLQLPPLFISVIGTPGSGKTYLTERLVPLINAAWYNADNVREMANDWDFSDEGRTRQSNRMRTFADFEKANGRFVVCDFVCPTRETRENFNADITIWMDTIKEGRFEDTNKLFQEPQNVDFHITEWNDHNHEDVAKELLKNV